MAEPSAEARSPDPAEGGASPAPAGASAEDLEEDGRLAARARAGDRQAFSALYERHARAVHGVVLALARPQDAQDLLQEVFLLALRSIGSLDQPERVGAWLCTIARNRARDAHKMKNRRQTMEPLDEDAPAPAGETGDAAEAAEVLELVRGLPATYRETLVLRLVEGLTGPEIARHTGLTHGSVRVNLHRGMKLLREKLAQRGWEVSCG